MSKKIWKKFIGVFVIAITLVIGMLVGAWFGGNYAENFQFNGVQGYEATSQIGLLCGIFALLVMGAYRFIMKRIESERKNDEKEERD